MPFIPNPNSWKEREPCRHPEHDPPSLIVLPPGNYTWQCPGCGHLTTFRVDGMYLGGKESTADVHSDIDLRPTWDAFNEGSTAARRYRHTLFNA